MTDKDSNNIENDLEEIVNLHKKQEAEIAGLSESDLRSLLHIMGHIKRMENSYVKMVPSVNINLPSGLSGRLVWKSNTGYVFALDLVSSLKM
jgi:hypothetical protein